MQNAALDESQAGIRTAGRNINNLRYADDTILMAESEDKLKSLLIKVYNSMADLNPWIRHISAATVSFLAMHRA